MNKLSVELKDYKGHWALITGASSGIGKEFCFQLAENEMNLVIVARRTDRLEELAQEITKLNVKVIIINCDLSAASSIDLICQRLKKEKIRPRLICNNAGAGITGPIEEIPDVEIKNNFDTNFFGPIHVIKAVLPQMRKQNSGLIINVTSIAGYMGLPYRGVYSASKGALELITEAFRMEVKSFNIKMTNVAPGDFATNIAAGRYHAPLLDNSPYKKTYGETLSLMDSHVDGGSDPNEMAKAVFSIINSKNPKIHYKVGAFIQKFSIVLKRILPDTIYEKMLMNHYKL